METINNYRHKAKILRKIHSNNATKYRKINTIYSVTTIVVSSLITFIGFYGLDKLSCLLNLRTQFEKNVLEFVFSFSIFLLFVSVISHLVFQFSKKQSDANRAIVLLTSFINETNDIIESVKNGIKIIENNIVEIVRSKYNTITSTIPENTDKQYLKAKKNFEEKQSIKLEIPNINTGIFDETYLETYTSALIRKSPLYEFLKEIREVNPELYLGGGAMRNLVWDKLHNYTMYTQFADLDIVYYDKENNIKENDKLIEQQLFAKRKNIKWSVKNQARMHIVNNENQYNSLFEAIQKWPETCTAIVVRLNKNSEIEYIKPYGLTDLYRLIVTPTPHFLNRLERYRERVNSKNWNKTWDKLRIFNV
jgi:hypothetical protein